MFINFLKTKLFLYILLAISLLSNFITFISFNPTVKGILGLEYIPAFMQNVNTIDAVQFNEICNKLDSMNVSYTIQLIPTENNEDTILFVIETLAKDLPIESEEFSEFVNYMDSFDFK